MRLAFILAVLVTAWARAVQALVDTNLTCAWGSRARRDRLGALARDPHMLAASARSSSRSRRATPACGRARGRHRVHTG